MLVDMTHYYGIPLDALIGRPIPCISISEYNALLTQFLERGDEITRLQSVVKDVVHYLIAKKDIGELSAVEDALLLECERAMEAKE